LVGHPNAKSDPSLQGNRKAFLTSARLPLIFPETVAYPNK
jgi:hypothetical protein